jgi:hypothetical protein
MANSRISDIVLMDGVGLSHAIKSKQVSCLEVMTAYLDHIDIFNPRVNAIISIQPREALLAEAKKRDAQLARGEYLGWMHGLWCWFFSGIIASLVSRLVVEALAKIFRVGLSKPPCFVGGF